MGIEPARIAANATAPSPPRGAASGVILPTRHAATLGGAGGAELGVLLGSADESGGGGGACGGVGRGAVDGVGGGAVDGVADGDGDGEGGGGGAVIVYTALALLSCLPDESNTFRATVWEPTVASAAGAV